MAGYFAIAMLPKNSDATARPIWCCYSSDAIAVSRGLMSSRLDFLIDPAHRLTFANLTLQCRLQLAFDRLMGRVHLRVGQRPIRRAERQRIRQRLLARCNRST